MLYVYPYYKYSQKFQMTGMLDGNKRSMYKSNSICTRLKLTNSSNLLVAVSWASLYHKYSICKPIIGRSPIPSLLSHPTRDFNIWSDQSFRSIPRNLSFHRNARTLYVSTCSRTIVSSGSAHAAPSFVTGRHVGG